MGGGGQACELHGAAIHDVAQTKGELSGRPTISRFASDTIPAVATSTWERIWSNLKSTWSRRSNEGEELLVVVELVGTAGVAENGAKDGARVGEELVVAEFVDTEVAPEDTAEDVALVGAEVEGVRGGYLCRRRRGTEARIQLAKRVIQESRGQVLRNFVGGVETAEAGHHVLWKRAPQRDHPLVHSGGAVRNTVVEDLEQVAMELSRQFQGLVAMVASGISHASRARLNCAGTRPEPKWLRIPGSSWGHLVAILAISGSS